MDIPLLPDIVAIFCLSIGVLLVCHQVKIPPIVGFLLTGVLCGPTALGLVQNPHAVELLAEIGVVLLLFSIGLEMSGEELMRLKRPVFVGGTAQVVLTVGAFMCLGVLTGQTWQQSMMYGFLASLSSTAIVLSRLQQKGAVRIPPGQARLFRAHLSGHRRRPHDARHPDPRRAGGHGPRGDGSSPPGGRW